jgi:uracil-DNA glycosylase
MSPWFACSSSGAMLRDQRSRPDWGTPAPRVEDVPSPQSLSDTELERLANDRRIAPGWVNALRAVDAAIDAKVEKAVSQLPAPGDYLPLEHVQHARMWRAYAMPPSEVRVLILGQDPYPDVERATGLSFSTGPGGDIPHSLRHIHDKLVDLGYERPDDGDLTPWTHRGVMLLNRALTIPRDRDSRPRRHLRLWRPVAIATMKAIGTEAASRPVAALLWGVPAQGMAKHLGSKVEVFRSSHPSPMSVDRMAGESKPFGKVNHFREVNEWFGSQNAHPVDWSLAPAT